MTWQEAFVLFTVSIPLLVLLAFALGVLVL